MGEHTNRVGERIGNYQLTHLLGKGGFAEVYLAEHIHLNTQAAVKLLHTRLADEDTENFRNEARTIARLVHPHIVRVLDFGVEDSVPYLVMDYALNGTLRQLHPKGSRLRLEMVVGYVRQVAEALHYAHEQRLIHRDIKPENMLLGRNREVLLSDFGIALVAQSSNYQSTQNIAGTIAYMAPEQIQAHPRPASDQYALGIVVYEWLCGNRPFQGSYTEIAIKHSLTAPPPLRTQRAELPPAVEEVVMIALQKDPARRFPNVRLFAEALEQAGSQGARSQTSYSASGGPTGILPPPASVAAVPGAQYPYGQFSPMAQYRAGEQRISAEYLQQQVQAQPVYQAYTPYPASSPPQAVYPQMPQPGMYALSGQQGQTGKRFSRRAIVAGVFGLAGLAAASSGLTWFVVSRNLTRSGSGGLHPALPRNSTPHQAPENATSSALATYQGQSGYIWSVAWSPDGKYIASASDDGTVHVWEPVRNTPRLLSYRSHVQPAVSDDAANAAVWSPDGKRIAVAFTDGTAQIVDVVSRGWLYSFSSATAQDSQSLLNGVAWSPDGRFIAFGGFNDVVLVYEIATQKLQRILTGHTDTIQVLAWSHNGRFIASGAQDGTIRVWRASDGQMLLIYKQHTDDIRSIAWSPDDGRIASGSWDGTAKVWSSDAGQTLLEYTKHTGGMVNAVAWSHDGQHIASGGNDVNTHVWEAQTGKLVRTFPTFPIFGVSWAPDDSRIVTGGFNKIAQVWQVR